MNDAINRPARQLGAVAGTVGRRQSSINIGTAENGYTVSIYGRNPDYTAFTDEDKMRYDERIHDMHRSYTFIATTPEEVAQHVIAALS